MREELLSRLRGVFKLGMSMFWEEMSDLILIGEQLHPLLTNSSLATLEMQKLR